MSFRLCLLWFVCLASPVLLPAQDAVDGSVAGPLPTPRTVATMTNDSIVRLVKAGLSDVLIIQTIGSPARAVHHRRGLCWSH